MENEFHIDSDYIEKTLDNSMVAVQSLSNSISRGTHHFDRDHTHELFTICVCDDRINPECPLHKEFLDGQ